MTTSPEPTGARPSDVSGARPPTGSGSPVEPSTGTPDRGGAFAAPDTSWDRDRRRRRRQRLWVAVVVCLQIVLVAAAVAPRLSARGVGREYRMRVAQVDPIDPFRGAYVALSYPDLPNPQPTDVEPPDGGTVYLALRERDGLWRGTVRSATRPDSGPYLACRQQGWQLRCGIESWFVSQQQAARMSQVVRSGHAIAIVRIDGRGHAALVDVRADEPAAS